MFAAALWNSLCLSARQPILLRCGWHPDTSSKTMTIYLTDGRHHVDIVCRRDKSLTCATPSLPAKPGPSYQTIEPGPPASILHLFLISIMRAFVGLAE